MVVNRELTNRERELCDMIDIDNIYIGNMNIVGIVRRDIDLKRKNLRNGRNV